MDKQELAKRLMATFLEELHEHVEALTRELLALEKDPADKERAEILKLLFRSVHSLKGASRAVSVEMIESACHHIEEILCAVRDGGREFTPRLASLLLAAADAIADAGTRLRFDQELAGSSLSGMLDELLDVAAGNGPAARGTAVKSDAAADDSRNESVASGLDELDDHQHAPTKEPSPTPTGGVGTTIRVSANKLDSLLAQSGELLVARRRVEFRAVDAAAISESAAALRNEWRDLERPIRKLCKKSEEHATDSPGAAVLPRRTTAMLERTSQRIVDLAKDLDQLSANMIADGRLLAQNSATLDDEVHRVRMLPFAEACGGFERAVRDLAQTTNKQINLTVDGTDVEVDRSVLEGIKDPLMHLVRNAVDHGIEPPNVRQENNKPPVGHITVAAALRGGQVEIIVSDDGRGFNLERIRAKARKQGLAEPEDERELARLVFMPGFSTAAIVTDVSGRGVGLDVVQSQIEALHGAVDVAFHEGAGTTFTLTVPLTLTTIRCMLAVVGDQSFALPTATVRKIVRFDSDKIGSISGRDVLLLGETPIPIAELAATLEIGRPRLPVGEGKQLAVIVSAGEQHCALLVDEVTAEQEVLVKNLGARIRRVRHVAGATLLPTGTVALVLNVANVIRTALGQAPARTTSISAPELTTDFARRRLLVVDDSVTTRTLMKSILETAGYEVVAAVDGRQAWQFLERDTFDLVVSDVDMPRMNGFDLTSSIRNSSQFANLPVVLVTARGSAEDKTRGVRVGANAYLVKSNFDQTNLLETVQQLL